MSHRIIVASSNAHKVGELADMLGAAVLGVEVTAAGRFGDMPDVPETRGPLRATRPRRWRFCAWLASRPRQGSDLCLADDSGVCVDALDGAPGVYSARFAGPNATDTDNNEAVCAALAARGLEASAAHYVCVVVLRRVDGAPLSLPPATSEGSDEVQAVDGLLVVTGRCHGEIRVDSRGDGGFGYDPHFWVDGGARTFAELTPEQKAARSHRGAAMQALIGRWQALGGL